MPRGQQFHDVPVSAGFAVPCPPKWKPLGKGRESPRARSEVTFHSPRHTATSMFKHAGVAEAVARDTIGHESAAISRHGTPHRRSIEAQGHRRAARSYRRRAAEEGQGLGTAVVRVAFAQPLKRPWVVTDNDRVHALGDGDLPSVILAHALRGTALTQRCPLGLLMPDGLPAEGAKRFAHRTGIGGTFQHLGGSDRRNLKLGTAISPKPSMGRPDLAVGNLVEIVDDEGGIQEEAHHLLRLIRSDESPQFRSLQASASAPVTISSSRINLRTKVAFFIPARFGRLARIPCSSLVSRTVRTARIVFFS